MKKSLIGLLILLSFSAQCQTNTKETVKVEPYMRVQNYEHFKRLILITDRPNAEFIDNFDFEWGYTYELEVQVETFDEPLSDGTLADFTLVNEISKTKAPDDYEFKMFLDSHLYYSEDNVNTFQEKADGSYLYFERVLIEVPEELDPEFQKIRRGKKKKHGYFRFVGENRIRLMRF